MTIADGGVDLGETERGLEADGERLCNRPGCSNLLPADADPRRQLCDEHYADRVNKTSKKRRPKKLGGGEPKPDRPPVDVNINLGGKAGKGKADQNAAKVTAGATQAAQMVAALIGMGGDMVCANAINEGAVAWGKAMGELSRYQPALVKIFAPTGEATGQVFAWVGVFAATFGMVVPVLVHHGAIRPELAAKIVGGTGAATGLAEVVTSDDSPADS